MVKAIKGGITRTFTDDLWKRLPKGKYGWIEQTALGVSTAPVPAEIVLKKKEPVAAVTVTNVPEEIKVNVPIEVKPEPILVEKPVENLPVHDDLANAKPASKPKPKTKSRSKSKKNAVRTAK